MENYTLDYFIEKIFAASKSQHSKEKLFDSETNNCCSLGHCRMKNPIPDEKTLAVKLSYFIRKTY